MKPSKRVQRVIILVAILPLLGGLSVAQEPNAKEWGAVANGLQMRISLDQAVNEQFKVPRFRVELRNVGAKDLLLNLGTKSRDGRRQYLTAVSLVLVDAHRGSQWLELKRTVPVSHAGTEALSLPLPVGASFSFPVNLDDYWVATSEELDHRPKPGTYLVAAHLNGFINELIRTDPPFPVVTLAGLGQLPTVRTFDTVNPEIGLGPPPISKALRIEIPSR
jgi:hypothetical protein